MSDAVPQPFFDVETMVKARKEGTAAGAITDLSVDDAVKQGIFRFAPPLIERSPRPKALYLEWRAFQYVFEDIADPRTFPRLPETPSAADLRIFRRYIESAEELAESEQLCGTDRVTVRWRAATDDMPESTEVESEFTSKEIARGFAALLRQFDSAKENASFQRVNDRLRVLSAEMIDSHERRRLEQIDAWRKAQGKLHGAELQRLTRRKLGPEFGNEHPPTRYLSGFNYTDVFHWDAERETEWQRGAIHPDFQRIAWTEAATSLAYLYIGFSELVRAAINAPT
jgi:hypothetical protein